MNICSAFFILEAVLKILSQGFYKHRNAYLQNWWNFLDFAVVITTLVEIIVSLTSMGTE
jgi:hypothetical protein